MLPKQTKPRKKALNYRAQEVKRQMFTGYSSKKGIHNSSKKSSNFPSTSRAADSEIWLCSICNEDFVADMRACASCRSWVHEECVGLTNKDKEAFFCSECLL